MQKYANKLFNQLPDIHINSVQIVLIMLRPPLFWLSFNQQFFYQGGRVLNSSTEYVFCRFFILCVFCVDIMEVGMGQTSAIRVFKLLHACVSIIKYNV